MVAGDKLIDSGYMGQDGQSIHQMMGNTVKDGSGTPYIPVVDSEGKIVTGGGTEALHHPFGKGSLLQNGGQYSALHTTTTDNYESAETVTITQPVGYTLTEIEFCLTGANQSSSTAEAVLFKWQASDAGTLWEDLCAEQTHAADAAALEEETWAGVFAPTGNFLGTGSSFQVRYAIKSGSAAGETAKGKTKASSYIICRYRRT